MAGCGIEEGPLGEEPAITFASRPGFARWSTPLTPYMSPAAIGCRVVRLRGWPSASNRAPMAASTASGQPRPLDELTVTTAPSGTGPAASAAASIRTRAISGLSQHFVQRHAPPLARRAL